MHAEAPSFPQQYSPSVFLATQFPNASHSLVPIAILSVVFLGPKCPAISSTFFSAPKTRFLFGLYHCQY